MSAEEQLLERVRATVAGAAATLNASVARLNDLVSEAAASEGVLLLDVARASLRDGIGAWFDAGRWMQAKMEIAPQAAPLYGDLVARIVDEDSGGMTIRGAKMLGTSSIMANEVLVALFPDKPAN